MKTATLPETTSKALENMIRLENVLAGQLLVKRSDAVPRSAMLSAAQKWSDAVFALALAAGPLTLSPDQRRQGLTLWQHPVLICGCHRSGTTLLRDLLDGHPDLLVLPSEGTYYTHIEPKLRALPKAERLPYLTKEWIRRFANPINQAPYWLLGRSSLSGSPYVDFARYVLAWWANIEQIPGTSWPHQAIVLAYASISNQLKATYWVDKTPTNEQFLPRIWSEMPKAKVLHMIRDPLDVLASYKVMDPHHPIRIVLRNLRRALSVANSRQPTDRFLLLRYEALCLQSEKQLETLCRFLAIPFHASLESPSVAGFPASANSSFHPQAPGGILLRTGKRSHADSLNAAEKRLLAAYVGSLATKQRYPLQHLSAISRCFWRIQDRIFNRHKNNKI